MLSPSSMNARVFVAVAAVLGLSALVATAAWRPPGIHTGYAPVQPVAYSHRLHAGELGIDCLYCHYGARTSRHAGIPPTSLCMNCHTVVGAAFDAVLEERARAEAEGREPRRLVSPEIAKIHAALAVDADGRPTGAEPQPIPWVRVHDLPDFVAFDHSVHVARGLACASCHGPVQTMERVRQESDLSMGWCMDCHRRWPADDAVAPRTDGARLDPAVHVSTDCAVCHY